MIIAVLIVLGLCFGSFVNALIYRLHWQETHSKATKAENKKYSIAKGRSICPNCKHELTAKDLVPIFSWLYLRGRCKYCAKPISWQYPLVEAATAALFVTSYVLWPQDLSLAENIVGFATWILCLVGFVALTVYDIKYMILPNKIIFILIMAAIASILLKSLIISAIEPITVAMWGAVIGGGLFYLLFQISGGAWIGGGDVKLGFLIGLLVGGPVPALLVLFLASLLGTLYSVPLMLARKVKARSRIPFGPFLIISAIIVQLFGNGIVDWYTELVSFSY